MSLRHPSNFVYVPGNEEDNEVFLDEKFIGSCKYLHELIAWMTQADAQERPSIDQVKKVLRDIYEARSFTKKCVKAVYNYSKELNRYTRSRYPKDGL